MCEGAAEDEPEALEFVLDHLNTKTMCERVVEEFPRALKNVPDLFETQEMCEKAVKKASSCLYMSLIITRYRRCARKRSRNLHFY